MSLHDRGLDLSNPDVMTPEEHRRFREFYIRTKGYALPAFEFWADFQPDVLKRYRLQALHSGPESIIVPLSFLHLYSVVGYGDGVLYEVRNCQSIGATKAQILETMALAFLHAGPRGMGSVATSSADYMRTYVEPIESKRLFPVGWEPDPDAFKAGLDFSTADLSADELARLEAWYMRYEREVPSYVRFLAEFRPALLKAYRQRFEHSHFALPKQMVPYMLLHFEVSRGLAEGIREGVLLARGFGMTKTQALEAISWGMLYGGPTAIAIVDKAAGDVLRNWD